ncbi:peptidyl-prolyl cis-trans isomerase [Methylorubrum populi]|uniref:Peptidyl-prolyl cis-trans isomerase n=1 Tax=Methylorubrum populi TaxID=223967 RepID=A0A160PIM9_9HYPH|nr:peptidyl-prolyl cis-trans isomerase [Methylorubrum populi]
MTGSFFAVTTRTITTDGFSASGRAEAADAGVGRAAVARRADKTAARAVAVRMGRRPEDIGRASGQGVELETGLGGTLRDLDQDSNRT